MVKGLDLFRKHFDGYADQFILIGGTAATLAMEQAGLEFRATKDLDIVLHIEVLKPAFGTAFWEFVETGGYGCGSAPERASGNREGRSIPKAPRRLFEAGRSRSLYSALD